MLQMKWKFANTCDITIKVQEARKASILNVWHQCISSHMQSFSVNIQEHAQSAL